VSHFDIEDALQRIAPGQVQVWHISIDALLKSMDQSYYLRILSAEEIDRLKQFHFEGARKEYLATRILVRNVLSYYRPDVDPKEWAFEHNEYQKPRVRCEIDRRPLQFNLSHSAGIVVCAVALEFQVGIDIESRERKTEWLELAKQSFSEREFKDLEACQPNELPLRFWKYWTLKEAFIKAVGLGLSLPLDEFTFRFKNSIEDIQVEFSGAIKEDARDWKFMFLKLLEKYEVALAAKCGPETIELIEMGGIDFPDVQRKGA
jgi:4'-phosphopantetheinyl transferase